MGWQSRTIIERSLAECPEKPSAGLIPVRRLTHASILEWSLSPHLATFA
jgi:hypothetical protein